MKREEFDLNLGHGYDSADIAAAWPVSAQIAPLPISEIEVLVDLRPHHPAPAAPDVPAAIGGLIAASYAALIAALAWATAGSGSSIFAIAIAAFFVVVFFTVPRIFFAIEPSNGRRVSLDRFLGQGLDTLTGHNSGKAVMVQMLVVPISLTLGVFAIGTVVAIVG